MWVLVLSTASLAGTSATSAALDQPVLTSTGRVSGIGGAIPGVRSFKGIPYAAPPVGRLRWRPPEAAAAWKGVLAANQYGPDCPQVSNYPTLATSQSENCLWMNIWTPAHDTSERLPVMVWIHGGGFSGGSGALDYYDGSRLATKGVVVVNFNYRVGLLGFLVHPALSAESEHHVSGNYGMLDMVAALTWVRANIANFGGDPDRVTLFGESSASVSVNLLASSPLAAGLFARTINQSGADLGSTDYTTLRPMAVGEARSLALIAPLGAKTAPELRALSVETLLKAKETGGLHALDPVIDGYFLPKDVREIYTQGRQSDVPMLLGHTTRESSQLPQSVVAADFRAQMSKCYPPAAAATVLAVFPADDDGQAKRSRDSLYDMTLGPWAMRGLARLQKGSGKSPVYFYTFDQAPPYTAQKAGTALGGGGAYHAADIPYALNNLDLVDLPWTSDDRRTAELMTAYWVNFAATGNPNGPGLPAWPAYEIGTERSMWLQGTNSAAGRVPESITLDLLDRLKAAQRTLPLGDRC